MNSTSSPKARRADGVITKSDLVDLLAERTGMARVRAEIIVNTVFDGMAEALSHGGRVEIRGFGSFNVREYKSYEGRNPRTGLPVSVPPKRLPFFKVGKELRERLIAVSATRRDPSDEVEASIVEGAPIAAADAADSAPPARPRERRRVQPWEVIPAEGEDVI